MIAMAGMLFSGDKTYMSFAIATMMVVAVAMLGSLTVLPALLSKLGDRVEKGRIPFLHRLRARSGENRVWGAILDPVLRHPVDRGASPPPPCSSRWRCRCCSLHTAQSGLDALPNSAPTVEPLSRRSRTRSRAAPHPAIVAIKADDSTRPPSQHAIAEPEARGARDAAR